MEEDAKDEGEEDEEESSESEGEDNEDDDDDEEEEDPELRRKIEEALRVAGIEAASEGEDDDEESEDEDVMDDDQMMALDAHLAEIFRSRMKEKGKGHSHLPDILHFTDNLPSPGTNAQREATHFKNRVLDLVDIFLRNAPTSPHTLSFPVPLVRIIMSTGPDEKQLSDKVKAVLRSRFGKAKEVPNMGDVDVEKAVEVLKELHAFGRKANVGDVRDVISGCSLYVSKVLLSDNTDSTAKRQEAVIEAYRATLSDFALRKASPLQVSFVQDFFKRHPKCAWGLRGDVVELGRKAVNEYRKCQVLGLVQVLFSQTQAIVSGLLSSMRNDVHFVFQNPDKDDLTAFVTKFRQVIVDTILEACDKDDSLNASQVKELLKLLLLAIRSTKKILGDASTPQKIWDPSSIASLSQKLKASRLQASTSLHGLVTQILAVLQWKDKDGVAKDDTVKDSKKRKADDTGDKRDGEHKKARKKEKKKNNKD